MVDITETTCTSRLFSRLRLKCDGTRAETRFRFSAKRMIPFKSAGGTSVQSTAGSRGVRIRGSNAGYNMFRASVKSNGYPLHSSVSPSLPHRCDTVCHHISTGFYLHFTRISLVVWWSEILATNHEVPGSIPCSTIGIFLVRGGSPW